jgi:hypothetical protein
MQLPNSHQQYVDENLLMTIHQALAKQLKDIPGPPTTLATSIPMNRKAVASWLDKYCQLFSISINHQGKWIAEIKP